MCDCNGIREVGRRRKRGGGKEEKEEEEKKKRKRRRRRRRKREKEEEEKGKRKKKKKRKDGDFCGQQSNLDCVISLYKTLIHLSFLSTGLYNSHCFHGVHSILWWKYLESKRKYLLIL